MLHILAVVARTLSIERLSAASPAFFVAVFQLTAKTWRSALAFYILCHFDTLPRSCISPPILLFHFSSLAHIFSLAYSLTPLLSSFLLCVDAPINSFQPFSFVCHTKLTKLKRHSHVLTPKRPNATKAPLRAPTSFDFLI